jgi:hypothetical protein
MLILIWCSKRNMLKAVLRKGVIAVVLQFIKYPAGGKEFRNLTKNFRLFAIIGGLLGLLAAPIFAFMSLALMYSDKYRSAILATIFFMSFLSSLIWFITNVFIILSGVYFTDRRAWVMRTNMIAGSIQVLVFISVIVLAFIQDPEIGMGFPCFFACFAWVITSIVLVARAFVASETLRKIQEGQQAQTVK